MRAGDSKKLNKLKNINDEDLGMVYLRSLRLQVQICTGARHAAQAYSQYYWYTALLNMVLAS